METKIPDGARVAPGATYTGWKTWIDAGTAAVMAQIENDPTENPNSKNSKLFSSLCSLGELVAGGHVSAREAEQDARAAAKKRFNMPDKEFDRQWNNARKRTANNPRLYTPEQVLNGSAPMPPAADEQLKAGYHVVDGRLVMVVLNKQSGEYETKPLADIAAKITAVATSEDGQRLYTISGSGWRSGRFTFTIPAPDFESDLKLKGALGAMCPLDPIYPAMSRHLPAGLKTVSHQLQLFDMFNRTGWTADGGQFLMPGMVDDDTTVLDLPNDLPYHCPSTANLEGGLVAWQALLEAFDPRLTTPLMASLLAAPLAHLIGLRNKRWAVFLVGRTGSLKTAFATTALCIYGKGFMEERFIKWGQGATQNSIMKLATLASDMPLLVDNFKSNTGGGSSALVNLIHTIIEGGEKKRLDRNSNLRDTAAIYALPVFTGESLPALDAAALARLLPIQLPWNKGETNGALRLAQESAADLPAIGRAWLEWLMATDMDQWSDGFEDERRDWADWLIRTQPTMQNKLRVAQNLAAVSTTWRIVCTHPELGPIAQQYAERLREGLAMIAEQLNTGTDHALECQRFLGGMAQLLASGRVILCAVGSIVVTPSDIDRVVGYIEGEIVYLLPEMAMAAFRRMLDDRLNEFDTASLASQLDALGLLVRKNGGRRTYMKRVTPTGGVIRTWAIPKSALWPAEESAEETREPGVALGMANGVAHGLA
jgi:hypothetical protein